MHNPVMALEFTASYIKESTGILHHYKLLAERAIAQVPDEALTLTLDPESNSIATIMKHLAGNMRSRWTDFLTSDGEKSFRNRDGEFESPPETRAEMMEAWETGWKCVFDTLATLSDSDLSRQITIRNESHSVMQAITRHIAHLSYHTGQIVFLAKHFAGKDWKTLTIPRGKSADYNSLVASGKASQR
jgi:uncharacterized damage-inducible protein DinB